MSDCRFDLKPQSKSLCVKAEPGYLSGRSLSVFTWCQNNQNKFFPTGKISGETLSNTTSQLCRQTCRNMADESKRSVDGNKTFILINILHINFLLTCNLKMVFGCQSVHAASTLGFKSS